MNPETWPRIRSLFGAALELAPAEREAFLAANCGGDAALLAEVRALLHADAEDGLATPLDGEPGTLLAAPDLAGSTIAGFTIVRQIGAGGMGSVYEARQSRPARTVALKTLTLRFPSERARRRFEDEADTLARLRHPAIAQVLAAGTAQVGGADVPWFAMELVEEPRPIDRFVRERALDPRAIVTLFLRLAEAVQYAHQHGVIHRDLKPANVLVDRHGQPKVIDFGIARIADRDAMSRCTRTGEILGTLAYMSPERLERADEGDDTAADVYALGVILYELLAGRRPFLIENLPPARVVDVLRHEDPPRPSQARADVPLELDWITMKAIARERDRRYASVGDLARDLERHLRDEPVGASPPSASYRLRKLAWRHRLLLGVAVVTFLAVSIGFVVAALGWQRVATAEQLARRRATMLAEVNRFQERILKGAYGTEKGKDIRLADVVDAAARDLDRAPLADPIVEIGARTSIGASYLGLGRPDEAERHLLRARALLAQHGLDPHEGWGIPVRNNLALCYDDLGKHDLAEREARAALADRIAADGPGHPEVATSESNLASILVKRGAFAEALGLATRAHAAFLQRLGAGSEQAINAQAIVAQALAGSGRDAEAERAFTQARALAMQELHADHPARLGVATVWAGFLHKRRRFDEHVQVCEEIAAARERLSGPTHPLTLSAWNNLAAGQLERGQHAAAEATFRKVAAAWAALGVREGFEVVVTGQNLTVAVRRQGRAAEAEAMARALRETAVRSLPQEHWLIGVVTKEHGGCLRDLGRFGEAEPVLRDAHAWLAQALGANDYRTQKVVIELVALYEAWQRPDELALWRTRLAPQK